MARSPHSTRTPEIPDRRGFLRGLATLPLIGGSVALIGQPSAVAEPVSADLLEAYKTWLHYERRFLAWEMAEDPERRSHYSQGQKTRAEVYASIKGYSACVGQAGCYHGGVHPAPSTRAALVLSAVGCDWRAA